MERENGHVTEVASQWRENGHVTEVVSLMGGKIVKLLRWPV